MLWQTKVASVFRKKARNTVTRNTRTKSNRKQSNPKEWIKVATQPQFNLYQGTMETSHWMIRLNGSGGYLRRRFRAPSLKEALLEAPRVAGLEGPDTADKIVLLADAFSMALAITNRREASRRAWLNDTERFFRWLKVHHPLCTHWKAMTRQIIREYLSTYDGKSDNHKRLSLQPVLQTAAFMHREYGFTHIGERMGIGSKLKTPPRTVYLEDVVAFCDYLESNSSHLEVGAALQGLAGLQLQEALRLKWTNVDLERGLIEVTGEVKNDYRNRVIPVARRVLDALRRADARRRSQMPKVQHVAGNVVVNVGGDTYASFKDYACRIKAAMKRWKPGIDWAPKDLRNCLPTFAKLEGIHSTIWEQYIGHSPGTITERHYVPRLTVHTAGEEHALVRAMDLFRKFVTTPIEAHEPATVCNIWQLGETKAVSEGTETAASAEESTSSPARAAAGS